ncbi:Hydrogenase maturation protein, carbamoyl dehydratase HypE [Alteromonadaceae bacterium Bs31]|nr:Hydrogenase maturation protein, carbamoyl dehydratase HypE [Alteromonadaceae bacterium Bs31]
MKEKKISLAHGNGGVYMRELIDDIFASKLHNDFLNTEHDAAHLKLNNSDWAMTTDGFTVQPLFFPGGNIGSLAIHGTVNDLAVSGAKAKYLSLNAFLEEGLDITDLEIIVSSMAIAAKEAQIDIVTGDTKVLPFGHGGGIYFATTGIGERLKNLRLNHSNIQPGDKILVSGPIGNHGIAVMMAREAFGLSSDITSDSANIYPFVECLNALNTPEKIKCLRDPTRGGLNMLVQDWSRNTKLGVMLKEDQLPIEPAVASVCNMLGYDPFNLACEGRVLAAVSPELAQDVLQLWRELECGEQASCVGEFTCEHKQVVMETSIGGQRILQALEDEPLPRIC